MYHEGGLGPKWVIPTADWHLGAEYLCFVKTREQHCCYAIARLDKVERWIDRPMEATWTGLGGTDHYGKILDFLPFMRLDYGDR